jgi:hypothetical protein
MISSSKTSVSEGNVMVVCRFRPFNEKETSMGTKTCAEIDKKNQKVTIKTTVSS